MKFREKRYIYFLSRQKPLKNRVVVIERGYSFGKSYYKDGDIGTLSWYLDELIDKSFFNRNIFYPLFKIGFKEISKQEARKIAPNVP